MLAFIPGKINMQQQQLKILATLSRLDSICRQGNQHIISSQWALNQDWKIVDPRKGMEAVNGKVGREGMREERTGIIIKHNLGSNEISERK